jgi:hypothetical protein
MQNLGENYRYIPASSGDQCSVLLVNCSSKLDKKNDSNNFHCRNGRTKQHTSQNPLLDPHTTFLPVDRITEASDVNKVAGRIIGAEATNGSMVGDTPSRIYSGK